jgi:DNA-binding NarL/FixJ family response regulator
MDSLTLLSTQGLVSPLSLLLLEVDQLVAVRLAEGLGQSLGHALQVIMAGSIDEGLKMAGRRKFDLVVLDFATVEKLDTDSISLIRGFFPRIPIVVLVGFRDTAVLGQLIEAGMHTCIDRESLEGLKVLTSSLARGLD